MVEVEEIRVKSLFKIVFCLSFLMSQSVFAAPNIFFSTKQKAMLVNGQAVKCSFWTARCDFGDTFGNIPEAQAEYELYLKKVRWFPYLNWGAVVGMLAYSISTSDKDYSSGTAFTIFLVPWLSGIFVVGSSQKHLNRAINLYNGVSPDLASRQIFSRSSTSDYSSKVERGFATPTFTILNTSF